MRALESKLEYTNFILQPQFYSPSLIKTEVEMIWVRQQGPIQGLLW